MLTVHVQFPWIIFHRNRIPVPPQDWLQPFRGPFMTLAFAKITGDDGVYSPIRLSFTKQIRDTCTNSYRLASKK
jgi:hypothetical protein